MKLRKKAVENYKAYLTLAKLNIQGDLKQLIAIFLFPFSRKRRQKMYSFGLGTPPLFTLPQNRLKAVPVESENIEFQGPRPILPVCTQ